MLQVKYAGDKRSVMVTTKATAPGGARTEKVGLPFDPDLFDHMVEHGVVVEVPTAFSHFVVQTACIFVCDADCMHFCLSPCAHCSCHVHACSLHTPAQ